MSKKVVLVTGATGFVGSALVERHLLEGDTVRALVHRKINDVKLPKGVQLFHGDLTGTVESLVGCVDGVDILYHCAGEINDISKMHLLHVKGTQNLCDAAKNKIGHWVQLSSCGVYGPHYDGVVTEETALNPLGIYERTKTESDVLVSNAGKDGHFTYTILRPSYIFGPTMRNQSLFQMITMINRGFFFFIGKPGAIANYIYLDNVIEALMLCGKTNNSNSKVYNLSDYRKLETLVSTIAQELDRPIPKLRLPKTLTHWAANVFRGVPKFPLTKSRIDWLCSRSIYSSEGIQCELGYTHKVSMEDGFGQLVRTWKQKLRL